jgi:AraC family transcriptional regulator
MRLPKKGEREVRNGMSAGGAYGANLAKALSAKTSPSFLTKTTLNKSSIAVTQIKCDVADNVLTAPVENEDAILVMLQLRDWPKRILWGDGRPLQAQPLVAGSVSIFDLRVRWVGHRVCPIHQLNFYLPRRSIDEMADIEGVAHVQHFNNDPLAGCDDLVIWNLGRSLLQAFDRPKEANQLFVDHVTSAVAARVLRVYGIAGKAPRLTERKLSLSQEARIKEMIAERLDGALSTAELAAECSLSISEFNAAFERSVGTRPDLWLAERRVERAMLMLKSSNASVGQIAVSSGFCDRRHLARVFLKMIGVSPEEWRHLIWN